MIANNVNSNIPIILKLWNEEFGDSYDFIQAYIDGYLNENNYCLIFDDYLQPIGMAHYPQFNNEIGTVGYLYAVMVVPQYRKKGIAQYIIAQCFHKMRERGDTICITIPASESLREWYVKKFDFASLLNNSLVEFRVQDGFDFGGEIHEEDLGFIRILNPLEYLNQYCKSHVTLNTEIIYFDSIMPENNGIYKINNGTVDFTYCNTSSGISPKQLYTDYPIDAQKLYYGELT